MTQFDFSLLAYLDPVSGAMILQIIAAFVIGTGVLLRKSILAPLSWIFRREDSSEEALSSDDS